MIYVSQMWVFDGLVSLLAASVSNEPTKTNLSSKRKCLSVTLELRWKLVKTETFLTFFCWKRYLTNIGRVVHVFSVFFNYRKNHWQKCRLLCKFKSDHQCHPFFLVSSSTNVFLKSMTTKMPQITVLAFSSKISLLAFSFVLFCTLTVKHWHSVIGDACWWW